ncbi:MAG: RNA-binding protein [Victivallaceae bacterium]
MNIYVGNLPYSISEDELQEVFGEFGEVTSARIINDKMTGRSKGFAFVEMANDADAKKAIEALNEKEMGGRKAVVNEARPRPERPEGGGFRGGDRGGFDRGDRGGRGGFDRGGDRGGRSW